MWCVVSVGRTRKYPTKCLFAVQPSWGIRFLSRTARHVSLDFPEQYKKGRLNHASFGATPVPVRRAHLTALAKWMRYPDLSYFSEQHHEELGRAVRSCLPLLMSHNGSLTVSDEESSLRGSLEEETCLVDNASVATAAIAQRWMWQALEEHSSPKLLTLNHAYKGCLNILQAFCARAGIELVTADVPFPLHSEDDLLNAVEHALKKHRPTYAYIDHMTSQPAYVVPVATVVDMCRRSGVREIAVDGAQAIGSVPVDVRSIGADFWFSNIHKWGFAPPGACVFHGKGELLKDTHSPIPSWHYGEGFKRECLWTGTRDYSSMHAVPAAAEYLSGWRSDCAASLGSSGPVASSEESLSVVDFNHRGILAACRLLSDAWGTPETGLASMTANQRMVMLPDELQVPDTPGTTHAPVRNALRERFGVEAALGHFPGVGNFVRISHAIYNTEHDYHALRDGVLELLEEQRKPKQI